MARGRMIDQGFTRSEKINSVSRDARLVYASILTILDREGRTCAEPLVLKVNVFRKSDFTVEEIIAAVAELANVGLIRLYADEDNDAILEYVRFLDFNSPNSRERASDYPAPDGENATLLRDSELLTALKPHEPGADKADAPSGTATNTPTDNARATHMHSQRDVQGNVNGTLTVNGNVNGNARASPNPNGTPEKIEATPRRDTKGKPKRGKVKHEFDPAVASQELPENFDRELFQDFCARRLEVNAPMTLLALKQFVSKHKHHKPEELDEMFRAAIIAGWKDLYARDGKKPPAQSKSLDQYTERGL